MGYRWDKPMPTMEISKDTELSRARGARARFAKPLFQTERARAGAAPYLR
jgi:hypothetical protein